jgi:hypothetical protein
MISSTLALEAVLIVLLGATMFHAVRLERALGVLKRDRAVLESLVSGFNAATRQAEAAIERLRSAVDGAGRQVARQIDGATLLKDDLGLLIERGDRLADRLDLLARQNRPVAPSLGSRSPTFAAAAHSATAEVTRTEVKRAGLTRPGATGGWDGHDAVGADDPLHLAPASIEAGLAADGSVTRVRSQAERDLIRALRAAR